MPFRLFLHSVRMVFSQPGDTIRISGLLYLASFGLYIFLLIFLSRTTPASGVTVLSWQLLAVSLLSGLLSMWTAIAWHRFVLLNENPESPIPPFIVGRTLANFGRIVQIGLVMALILGAAMVVVLVVTGLIQNAFLTMVVSAAALVPMFIIMYRLAPLFPAAAVASPIGIGDVWMATKGSEGTLFGLAVITVIATVIIDLPLELFQRLPSGTVLALIWMFLSNWVKLMVGISLITTLYGVYIERRSI